MSKQAKKLAAYRQFLGLSQQQMGDRLGYSQARYSHYENDARKIPTELFEKLCNLDDTLNIRYFYAEDEPMFMRPVLKAKEDSPAYGLDPSVSNVQNKGETQAFENKLYDKILQTQQEVIRAKDELLASKSSTIEDLQKKLLIFQKKMKGLEEELNFTNGTASNRGELVV